LQLQIHAPEEMSMRALREFRPHRWNPSSWKRLTEAELLIDVAEFAAARGREPFTRHRCALSRELWSALERAPFSEIGRTALEQRVRQVIRAAEHALERRSGPDEASSPDWVCDFAAPVRLRAHRGRARMLRLHAERVAPDEPYITIGLPEDFSAHPLEGVERPAAWRG
jgi:hypothetical protein